MPSGLFNFLFDADNYDSRKVDRYETKTLLVSTCRVSDGELPYETAIQHPSYNNQKIIVVAACKTESQAHKNHNHWVKVMTSRPLPDQIAEVYNSHMAKMLMASMGGPEVHKKTSPKKKKGPKKEVS